MRVTVADRLKNIAQSHPDPFHEVQTKSDVKPSIPLGSTEQAYAEYLQKQTIELLQQARFLHARVLLALQANELDRQLCNILYDGFLNMAALVQVKE